MAIDVRIPARDAPRGWSVALVAAASLSVGVMAAWWGTEAEARDGDEDVGAMRELRAEGGAGPADPADEEPEVVPEADGPSEDRVALGDEPVAPAAPDEEPEPEQPEELAGASASPADPAPPSGLRVRQNRVAYIRCDGIDDCLRDASMEEAVWTIIEALPSCPTGPRAAGEADIRLDYRGTSPPEVAWRDTFPSSTVRLERDAVLGCVRDRLIATRQSLGAERLLVSFRFAME